MNKSDAIVVTVIVLFLMFLFAGCAYLVGWREWSPWWFVVPVVFALNISIGGSDEEE